jgi:ferrous iron transport protein B
VVALAGNPNSGKTTIFNNLTGANQHVGNYPGVTVERKEGYLTFRNRRIKIVDLPGTYSLSAYSIEEIIARKFIINENPDVVIDIVDAVNIERNLYLTTQLLELGTPLVIALNMTDMAVSRGVITDDKRLAQLLNVPVVPTIGNKRKGMDELLQAAVDIAENHDRPSPATVNYGRDFEGELASLTDVLYDSDISFNGYQPRWMALKLLEGDDEIARMVEAQPSGRQVMDASDRGRNRIETLFGDTASGVISDQRYGFISGACSEATVLTGQQRHNMSDTIDLALIHPILGLPIFAFLMWLMFNLVFTLGEKPMEWIETGIGALGGVLSSTLPPSLFSSLLIDGVIAGVGGVIVFLPNIMLLFLAVAILEDTGYMARAAFVMDRLMHKIGLHGKSFIPMLIGFGCSVPAYMSSRILEDRTDRLVTMHVTTFMSCGARLPVYILVCGAFWPHHAGNVVFSIYALGVVVAVGIVKLLRATRFKGMSAPFIMELPPYRVPTLRSLGLHMWERSWLYVRKAGTIILGISIIVWFITTFPVKNEFSRDYPAMIKTAEAAVSAGQASNTDTGKLIAHYRSAMASERIEYSFAGRLGKFIEPVIKPLGFDWRLGIALISGFAAKEVVVSTMGTIYGVADPDEESGSLREKLASDPRYSHLIAYAFLVFVLLYMPCMASMAVFLRESGSAGELLFQIGMTLTLAWTAALIVYQGGKLLGLG